jgi:hypothetical protein
MAIACDSTTLTAQARCLFPCIPPGLVPYAKIAVLCATINGTVMDCSAQNLVNQALCLQTCIPLGMTPYIELALLCAINNAGGSSGGGVGGVICAAASDPVGAPVNACTIAYRIDNGAFWFWSGVAWVQFISP